MNRFMKITVIVTVTSFTSCFLNCEIGCTTKAITDDNQYFSDDSGARLQFPTWMSQLSDNRRLTEISIPGTHDSAARSTISLAETQSMTITKQLEAGIRAFDIRCRHINDAFAMHHDRIFLNLVFDDVLDMSCNFLRSNPRETIIMRIKEEWNAERVTRSFQETLKRRYIDNPAWSSFITADSKLGKLGDYRGKILLMNDHGCNSDEFGFCWGSARIQDSYKLPFFTLPCRYAEWKMVKVQENLIASNDDNDNLYINFSSAQKAVLAIPKCLAKSCTCKGVNELATNLLRDNPTTYKKTGLFMMDYPGSALIKQILLRN